MFLALLDHVTCNYFWRYDLWWSHFWSCDKYDLAILTPSKNKMVTFIACISKAWFDKDCDHWFSPSSLDSKICIWWFSNKLVAFREKSYDKIITLCEANSRKWDLWPVTLGDLTSSHRPQFHISCFWLHKE
jgi:hypothetical protein